MNKYDLGIRDMSVGTGLVLFVIFGLFMYFLLGKKNGGEIYLIIGVIAVFVLLFLFT